ncbi:MAG: PAS domain-containing protein, partial [Methylococcales bacterium]|nr:PAS domain-containing protein [Methylococcales bacterium]
MTELQDVQQVLPILETLTEGVLLVDQKSNIHYANKSCESLFGYFPGELTGQPLNLL